MQMMELFTGCGGLALGMERAGFVHTAFIEVNPFACESLRQNFNPEIIHETDVRTVDFSSIGHVDAIAGGPPCQPFSLGGLARAHEDSRDMFPEAIRALSELRPRGFVFENVKGLLRKSFSEYFDYIMLRLTYPRFAIRDGESWRDHRKRLQAIVYQDCPDLKYRVQFKLINAADFGVPQARERVFIVGIRDDIPALWRWPKATHPREAWINLGCALKGIPDPQSPDHLIPDHRFVKGARAYAGHTGSPLDKPSKTIKAGAHGVPGGENMIRFPDGHVRYLTVYEAKTIQTFPPDFRISGSWGEAMRQIGNAVPVKLAEIIGRRFFETLLMNVGSRMRFKTDSCGNFLIVEQRKQSKGPLKHGRSRLVVSKDEAGYKPR